MEWESWFSEAGKRAKASDIRELLKITAQPDMISFAGGLPDPDLFPLAEYKAAMSRVIDSHGAQALQYSTTEGLDLLRMDLLARLREEGIACPDGIDNVILTSGSQQALDLLGSLLIDPGDTILVEAPTYLGALQAFNVRQPRYETITVDQDGLQIAALEATLARLKHEGRHPRFLYTVPTFQNPAGVTLSLQRRQALLEIAEREQFLLVEDDPYSRLRFRGQPVPTLKSMDRDDRVILLRTFSKTLVPGLRTGYIVAAPAFLHHIVLLKQGADLCSSVLNQYIVFDLLSHGIMERSIERVIEVYRRKEEAMTRALERHFADLPLRWNEPDGGMFFWVQLPPELDSSLLLGKAIELGVAYVKGSAFFTHEGAGRNCLRLNFTQPSFEDIERGIARLAILVRAALDSPVSSSSAR
jgi:2-aminoadipate transaminase